MYRDFPGETFTMQKNRSGEKESKDAECGLPFDGDGKYAGLPITERISDTIAVPKSNYNSKIQQKSMRRFIKKLLRMSLGKIFSLGMPCTTLNELLYLYIAFCYFVSHEMISDRAFARFMHVLGPVIDSARFVLGMENTELINKKIPWNADNVYHWVIDVIYGDYADREIYFLMPESCEKYLKEITMQCSRHFNQIFMMNDIRDDWWSCDYAGRTIYRIIGNSLLYRCIEKTNGDLYILESKQKSKMLARGIDNYVLDQENERVFIRYINRNRRFGCYYFQTGKLQQTRNYIEEKKVAKSVWTYELSGELLSSIEVNIWENYGMINDGDGILNKIPPFQCAIKRMELDIYRYIPAGCTFAKIMDRVQMLEQAGVHFNIDEVSLLKRTIHLFESHGFDINANVDRILESMYKWKDMIIPPASRQNLMSKHFLSIFENAFHKDPLGIYVALRNGNIDYLIKKGYLKVYEEKINKKIKVVREAHLLKQYVGWFDYDEKNDQILVSRKCLDLSDIDGDYAVVKNNKKNYRGEVKFNRTDDWFIVTWIKMDWDIAMRVRLMFGLYSNEVLFCGGREEAVIERCDNICFTSV